MTKQRRQRDDGKHRKHKQQRVRFRFEPLADEHCRDEHKQPQQRVVSDFFEQELHGFSLFRLRTSIEKSWP